MHTVLAKFYRLRDEQKLTREVVSDMAVQAAGSFLERYDASGIYLGEAIALLCELSTLEQPTLARSGVQGLFPRLIERLGDAFTPEACALYNRLFAQVIEHCRQRPEGQDFDRQLRRFGLFTQADILARAARVRQFRRFEARKTARIKKALVLSRVTIGADIAVTSVVLAALQEAFPRAEIGLVGNQKAHELFAGDPRVQLCAIDYPRGGGLFERLESWQRVVTALQRELQGLWPDEYVIVDPDSRLTQLGLLPLVADDRPYFFFESRSYEIPGLNTIGALTAHWLQQVFGLEGALYPYCAPAPRDVAAASRLLRSARQHPAQSVISVNFGVGGNPAKRLPDPFELRLLRRLLANGATVLLDQGGEPEEAARMRKLSTALQQDGIPTLALESFDEADAVPAGLVGAPLLTWRGGIGRLAALIAASDVYIGYDSAGQHIAAALGVPTIDLFAGFTSPRMPERWAPYGRGSPQVLVCDTTGDATAARLEAIIDAVLARLPGA
jgi:ADP-heptose:LPS heptosyltransferase